MGASFVKVQSIRISAQLGSMQGANKERWWMLCEQAANERDPKRLMELVKEINDLLEKKQDRLGHVGPSDNSKDSPAKLD